MINDNRAWCVRTWGPKTTSFRRATSLKTVRRSFDTSVFLVHLTWSWDTSFPTGSLGGKGGMSSGPEIFWYSRYGIVAMRGDRAQGLLRDARSCSSVGSMKLGHDVEMSDIDWHHDRGKTAYFMNLRAALKPHGSFSGRSKTFPNITSSAEYGFRNLPMRAFSYGHDHSKHRSPAGPPK